MKSFPYILLSCVVTLLISSCKNETGELRDILSNKMRIQVNPYERVPLSGLLSFRTEEECKVEIEIKGELPITKEFPAYTTKHAIPVLGLYPDKNNTIAIKLITKKGKVYTGEVTMKTAPLPEFFPTIEITKLDRSKMEPGLHLIELLIANFGMFHSYTIMFDDNGDIRWFMDLSDMEQIAYTTLRIENGNWLYLNWIDLYEFNDIGEKIRQSRMWNYAGNHHIEELSNGNLLMGGSGKDATVIRNGAPIVTRFDFMVEWNRNENKPVKAWDLAQVLDIDRTVYPEDYSLDFKSDWFHINSVAIDKRDGTYIVSGRNQGVLKVDNNNNLKWIFAPHKGWGKAGRNRNGLNTSDYLLTPVDSNNKPLNQRILKGEAGSDDFEWSTGQHAITILKNGNLLLFDNGLARNFKREHTYSRAVEYKIDEQSKTVKQVWEYGKARGLEMYSPITSDVDVLPLTGNRLITAGNIRVGVEFPHAKMIEITYPDNNEVFEATIYLKDAKGTGEQSWAQFDLVFKGERYSLYSAE